MSSAPDTPATLALDAAGTSFTAHTYDHDPRATSFGLEAAEKLGIDPAQVYKTLMVDVDGALVVAIAPVAGRVDLKEVARAVGGRRAAMADPAQAQRRTGYVVGGISPIGQKTHHRTVLDSSAILLETLLVSGGRRGLDLELAPDDLLAITGGEYADIARD
ncbi:Cys-tRNA(Pro) deacylase [Litorihabitans aurantiacus]|uniref:Cys-tRNA(Pro)/Cys-tRNA(Cys) deacylase n=1 Tax=Litorihabitans aurantiacus TaxID=1930061 RepID=A0AA37XGF9_9MICO|nr:Cys-tRNA(Pro) deacylase [Litorihabitans aurantiacus]GMA32777.1 Cys-tRNA(Pro)/Cys-tRNA(Cys) deacylase [Litorihabitans aurantiacus]